MQQYKGKRVAKPGKSLIIASVVFLAGMIVCLCAFLSNREIPNDTDMTMAAAALPTIKATASDGKAADEETKPATATSGDVQLKSETDNPTLAGENVEEADTVSGTTVKSIGIVNTANVNLREEPVDGKIIATLSKDTVVAVTGSEDGWSAVSYNEQSGYVSSRLLTTKTKAEFTCVGKIIADALNVRAVPSSSGSVICQAGGGAYVDVTGFENGWFAVKTNYGNGYVDAAYLAIGVTKPAVETPVTAPVEAAESKTVTEDDTTATSAAVSYSGSGAAVAATAQQYLGCSYSYGGSGPSSFDCSGFTMYIYGLYGVSLPHGATSQMGYGTSVSQSELQPGDLVFFSYGGNAIGHVGIYIGDRNFIHASTYGVGVIISSLDGGSYPSRYVGARRIL